MQEIAAYWTPERIENAIPRDLQVPKRAEQLHFDRNLKLVDEDDGVVPHHFDHPNQILIKIDENSFVECTVTHEPFDESDQRLRRAARPQNTIVSPTRKAVLTTSYIDFVVDIFDADGGDDMRKIVFFFKTQEKMTRTRFKPNLGNGRYTFRMGPFSDGDYKWGIKVRDSTRKGSKRKMSRFTVKLGGSDDDSEKSSPPTQPDTPPTSRTPPTGGGGSDLIQTIPSTNAPPTTTQRPPTTTNTPPTSTTSATTPIPDGINVEYFSPSPGETVDPVTFDWKIDAQGVTLVLLIVEYPDGNQAYMARPATGTGRDSVSVPVDGQGDFRWTIWVQVDRGSFTPGPWSTFSLGAGPSSPDCGENLGHYTERHQDLHKAVGRIMFRFGTNNYLCSGTLVEGADDRAIIATAAHCVYDAQKKIFPDYVMFIPGQDDGEGDRSDFNCSNDPHGCFYPTVGVISDEYRSASFSKGFQYDYGFYIAPDTDSGNDNAPDADTYGGNGKPKSLTPMGITFDGLSYGSDTHLFGYPGARDPNFMYTEGSAETSPITIGGWYVRCSGLTGGASGGPWTQSDPSTGRMVVGSVNSWGWSNGDPGMGSPPYDTGGAECVYNAANTANIYGGHVVASCPK